MIQNGMNNSDSGYNKNQAVHPALQKTFIVLAIISFTLGALVNFHTLKKLRAN